MIISKKGIMTVKGQKRWNEQASKNKGTLKQQSIFVLLCLKLYRSSVIFSPDPQHCFIQPISIYLTFQIFLYKQLNLNDHSRMSDLQPKQQVIEIQLGTMPLPKDQLAQPDQTVKDQVKEPQKPTEIHYGTRLKSLGRMIAIGLIISISALIFGYGLKEVTSVPIAILMHQYEIPITKFAAQSILIGILPIGSILGTVFTNLMISRYLRLTGIYVFGVINVGAIILVNINVFGILVLGRFIEGICVGYYTTIAPIYLKEIAPKELRKMLGLFFSLGKILGVLVVIIVELLLDIDPKPIDYRIILSMTAVLSILQAVLIFFFGSNTPAEMIEKGNEAQAIKIIENLYKPEYVQQILEEYKKQHEMEFHKGHSAHHSQDQNKQNATVENQKTVELKSQLTLQNLNNTQPQPNFINFLTLPSDKRSESKESESQTSKQNQQPIQPSPNTKRQQAQIKKVAAMQTLTFAQKKRQAHILGLHLCVIRHFSGGNTITTQGGLFINQLNPQLGHKTPIIINCIQFTFIVIGLAIVQKYIGKRPLFLFSVTVIALLNFALAIAMIYADVLMCQFIIILVMIVQGVSFISPVWSYPSEIIPVSQSLIPNIFHWLALAIATLVPPLIAGAMHNNNSYPVFLFFGFYGLISFFHIFRHLRESDGKSYNEIIESFK